MKNKVLKRMVAIFLAFSIVMCLSACSGKSDGKQKDSEVQNTHAEKGVNVTPDKIVPVDANCKVGDYITFGTYEQDNDTSNGKEPIKWLVLDKQDDKILVISKYALDSQPYNADYVDVTWEKCTLRTWLNKEFINNTFSSDEKKKIFTATVSADKNPDYDTDPGNATQDKVFLLSINEAKKYFKSDSARQCQPTDYAVANEAYFNSYDGNCWWWLRSTGAYQDKAVYVHCVGGVAEYGSGVESTFYSVRPAMWINL